MILSNKIAKIGSGTGQFIGRNIQYQERILWFAPHTFTFPQNMSDDYISRHAEGHINTYGYFFSRERKNSM